MENIKKETCSERNQICHAILKAITLILLVQTFLVIYLVFLQPAPKIDAKLGNLSHSLLDLETRIVQVERENAILFKMLRTENEWQGLTPTPGRTDQTVIPLPPKKIGDAPGNMPGEAHN